MALRFAVKIHGDRNANLLYCIYYWDLKHGRCLIKDALADVKSGTAATLKRPGVNRTLFATGYSASQIACSVQFAVF